MVGWGSTELPLKGRWPDCVVEGACSPDALRTDRARRLAHVLPPTELPLGSSVVRDRFLAFGYFRFLAIRFCMRNRLKL